MDTYRSCKFTLREQGEGCICKRTDHGCWSFGNRHNRFYVILDVAGECETFIFDTTKWHWLLNPVVGTCLCCDSPALLNTVSYCCNCAATLCHQCALMLRDENARYCYSYRPFGEKRVDFWNGSYEMGWDDATWFTASGGEMQPAFDDEYADSDMITPSLDILYKWSTRIHILLYLRRTKTACARMCTLCTWVCKSAPFWVLVVRGV